jgi:hypothetical protein
MPDRVVGGRFAEHSKAFLANPGPSEIFPMGGAIPAASI